MKDSKSRRPYGTPELTRHGSLTEMTHGGSGPTGADKNSLPITSSDRTLKRDVVRVASALERLRSL